jgi:hypothetical protein
MPNVVGSFEVGEPSQDQEDDLELEMSEPEAPQVVVTPTGSGLRTLGVPNRSTIDKDRVTSQVGGMRALAEARNQKTAFDNRKLDLESEKLEFEKQKWEMEAKLKARELDLEEKKIENDFKNSQYEIEIKYKTQLELAKISKLQ